MTRGVLVVVLLLLVAACGSDDSAPELESGDAAVPSDYEYVIPAGTGEQIDAGVTLRARVALRTWVGLGAFDDQAFLAISFLDGVGEAVRLAEQAQHPRRRAHARSGRPTMSAQAPAQLARSRPRARAAASLRPAARAVCRRSSLISSGR